MTKVLAINGSARVEKGNTAKVLGVFLEGMQEAGASVEIIYPKKLKITPCNGDFQCWSSKIGKCIHSDDMQSVYPKLREADILILGTPVYLPLPGEMQNLLNRLMPIVDPFLEFQDGRTRVRFHKDVKISKIVLVGVGGWWERANLDTVVKIVSDIATAVSVPFAGAILRPHARLMTENEEKAAVINEAIKKAGHQLIKDGNISPDLFDIISQPLISQEDLMHRSNQAYRKARDSVE